MSIHSVNQTALQGVQHGFERLNANTQTINQTLNSTPQAPESSLETALIDNRMTQTEIEALLKTLKTEDQLLGRLLDLHV
ncbi:MAG: hypothetical protein JXR44_08090 [Thiotrichales bacterium]|nr:hypothetical protein [Thiotrichales bacterium]